MEMLLIYIAIFLGLVGAFFAVKSYKALLSEMKGHGPAVYNKWYKNDVQEISSRTTVSVTIWVLMGIIGITALLYLVDKKAGGGDEMMDYLSFAGPCLGALVVGLGILSIKKNVEQPLAEIDFRYYFIGIPGILIGYIGFVVHHPSHWVNRGVWVMFILACGSPLVVRRAWGYPNIIKSDNFASISLACIVLSLLIVVVDYFMQMQ